MKNEQLIHGTTAPASHARLPASNRSLTLGRARLVKSFLPPTDLPARLAPGPEGLVAFRGQLYFLINLDDERRGLWKSDGTVAGTVAVKEFPVSAEPPSLGELVAMDSRLFFLVHDPTHGGALWSSDGTTAGTDLLKGFPPGPPGSFLSGLTVVRAGVSFFRSIPETPTTPARTELWKSDGTLAGTVRVRDLGAGSSVLQARTVLGDMLLFSLENPASGTELWRSDGTAAGTFLLKDIQPGPGSSYPFDLRTVAGRAFFTARDPVHGLGVWRTDGTSAGTARVEALRPGASHEGLRLLSAVGTSLYFTTSDSTDRRMRLYRLSVKDSHPGPARRVAILSNPFAAEPGAQPSVTTFATAGGKLFFGMAISGEGPAPRDVQLWVTDGTRAGTRQVVRPLSLSDEFESELYPLEGRILFSAFEEESAGLEPWISDGTPTGTRRLQDLMPGPDSSYPKAYTRVGMSVFFVASHAVHGNGLWVMPLRHAP